MRSYTDTKPKSLSHLCSELITEKRIMFLTLGSLTQKS